MSLGIGIMGALAAGAPGLQIPVAHRFWRLTITKWRFNGTDGSGSGTDVRVAEWNIFDVGDTEYPTPDMTGASAPTPLVATGSDFGSGLPPWKAFDGGVGNSARWISDTLGGTKWIQIDLGSGNSALPTYTKITPDSAVGVGGGYFILDFKIEGSATGLFSGEQQLFFSITGLTTGWTAVTPRQFNF